MKKLDIKTNTIEELKKLLKEAEKNLFDLRNDNALRKLKNFKSINFKKKDIARIKSEIRNKELTKDAR
jgi:ribosomal protein L29